MATRRRGLFMAVVLLSLLALTAGTVPLPGLAADHADAPLVALDAGGDISDIFVFDGTDPNNTVIIATVSPGAGVIGPTNFPSDLFLNLNIDHDGDHVTDLVYSAVFGPPLEGGTQEVLLFELDDIGATEIASGLTNVTLPVTGGGSMYAGLRSDPFFFDLGGFLGTFEGADNGRTFNDGMENDFFADLNTLALVLEVPDANLVNGAGPSINVYASSYQLEDQELVRVDRMGLPVINTVMNSSGPLVGADPTAQDIYNQGNPETDSAWTPNFEAAIAILSSLDTEGAYDAGQTSIVADMFLPDHLTYDTATSAGWPNGRRLTDDTIDLVMNIYSGGEAFPGRNSVGAIASDGIGPHTDFLSTFPYLGEPHTDAPSPTADSAGVINVDTGRWYLGDPILADLSAANEVPGPGDAGGSGTAQLWFDITGMVCFDLTFGGLTGAVSGAHVHLGDPDASGPVVIDLDWALNGPAGCLAVEESLIDQMLDDLDAYYVNVHTFMYPGGAIRGQLGGGPLPPFFFGDPEDDPFIGDWDGDSEAEPGLYRPSDGNVFLKDSSTTGVADTDFVFGNPGDMAISGDWDGDGDDTVSLYRPSEGRVFITNKQASLGTAFVAEFDFFMGDPGDVPFAGDFDGDGDDEIGVKRGSTWFLRYDLSTGPGDEVIPAFGDKADEPMFGDWDGDGLETPALYRPSDGKIYLRNSRTAGIADGVIFMDGFESGDTSAWTSETP